MIPETPEAQTASLRIAQSLDEFVRDQVCVREADVLAARAFFAWCCERLHAASAIIEIIPSGSFARGTCIHPLHDIDALVQFDLDQLRRAGVHDGTNLQLMFLGDILTCLAPGHQLSEEREWSYAAHVDGRDIALRRQGCSVGVCMGSRWSDDAITFDFVPCVADGGALEVIHRLSGRVRTNPAAAHEIVEGLDRALDGVFRTAVQLVKYWNSRRSILGEDGAPRRPFKSFQLEVFCHEFGRAYFQSFDDRPPELGAPLLHEVMTELFRFLRMHHRSALPVPGVPGEHLPADASRGEIEQVLRATCGSLAQARRSILAGDPEAAAEHWREVVGDGFQLSRSGDDERYRPRWQLSARRAARRGPWLRAAETEDLGAVLGLAAAPVGDAHAQRAIVVASALDHARVLEELLRRCAASPATLLEAAVIACRNDCRNALEVLLACEALDLGSVLRSPEAAQLLVIASHDTSADVVARLLARGSPVDGAMADGTTALMAAAVRGAEPIVALLQDAGASVDAANAAGHTALLFACEHGHDGVVAALLRGGASPTHPNRAGYSPLHAACACGHRRVVEVLMARPDVRATANDSAPDRFSPLVVAACRNRGGVVEALLEHPEVDVTAYCEAGWTALGLAAQEGNLEIVQLLLRRGAPVDAPRTKTVVVEETGATPLLTAASNGHLEVVRLLLAHGADVHHVTPGYSVSPLHQAVRSGHVEIVRQLLDAGADVEQRAQPPFSSPFFTACCANRPQIAELLLDRGVDVDVAADGWDAAFHAYRHGWPLPLLARFVERTTNVKVLGLVLARARLEHCHEVARRVAAAWKQHAGVADAWFLHNHVGIRCDRCGVEPIPGVRTHCTKCGSFDLCSRCVEPGIAMGGEGCRHELVEIASDAFLAEVIGASS